MNIFHLHFLYKFVKINFNNILNMHTLYDSKCFVKCLQMCFYEQHRTLFSITCYTEIVKAFFVVKLVQIAN